MSELRKWYRLNERYIGQGKEFGPRPEWATELVALMDQGVFWCDSPPPVDPSGYRLDHVTSVRRIVDHWAGDSECIRVAELLDRSDAGEAERNPLQQVESGVAKVIDGLSKMGKAAAGPQPDETSATENREAEAERPVTYRLPELHPSWFQVKSKGIVPDSQYPAPGYELLAAVFRDAHDQAAIGKGEERHARGQPFREQRMQSIAQLQRSPKGMEFQVHKKVSEGLELPDPKARRAELLGAINYIAGIIIYLDGEEAAK